jgi:SAM-dependent methyltransferase
VRQEFPSRRSSRFIRYDELTGLTAASPVVRLVLRRSGLEIACISRREEVCRREVLDRLDPKGGRVLEVSIGPGVNLPYLIGSPSVGEVYGLDISLGQIRRCRSLCRRRGWSVDLFLGNAEELPFRDESFESVFHIGGINFFSDKKKAIEEMIRVAKPGAKVVIVDESERGARLYVATIPGFRRIFRGESARPKSPCRWSSCPGDDRRPSHGRGADGVTSSRAPQTVGSRRETGMHSLPSSGSLGTETAAVAKMLSRLSPAE